MLYKILKKGQPLVYPGASGGQHPKDLHLFMSEIILGCYTCHNHRLVLSEWCLYLEQIHSYIQMDTIKGKPQHHNYQWRDD